MSKESELKEWKSNGEKYLLLLRILNKKYKEGKIEKRKKGKIEKT